MMKPGGREQDWVKGILGSQPETQGEQIAVDVSKKDAEELERSKKHAVHWVWLIFIYALLICGIAALVVTVLNYLLPDKYCWLNEEKLHTLTSIYLAGLIGYMLKKADKWL